MKSMDTLFHIYWKIQGVIAPKLLFSQDVYENVLRSYLTPKTRWLDIGCGHRILPEWRSSEEKEIVENCKTIVGFDYDLNSLKKHKNLILKIRGDISELPFCDNSFDLVTANMVVEHLEVPNTQFKEINRILKSAGVFILHTPNAVGYTTIMGRLIPRAIRSKLICLFQGRKEEDIFDTYYRANSISKIRDLAKITCFEVLKIKMLVSSAQFIIFPPLVLLETIWIRILMLEQLKKLRTNIIAILKKR